MRYLDSIIYSMDMNWSKLQDIGRMGSLASCCSPWGCKESDTTFQLDNNCFTNCNKCTRPKRIILMFSSVAQLRPTLCDPMNCSTPGLPVHHKLPEFTETHVHRVSDVIQPSHPLSSPSPPAPNPSQHQGLFQ